MIKTDFSLGMDFKLFDQKQRFFQIAAQSNITNQDEFGVFGFDLNFKSVTLGIGVGRINYVNDAVAALNIIEKLKKLNVITRELTENEYQSLVQRINALKNRRRFANRSYPLTEVEEIHDLLHMFGVLNESINTLDIIDEAYKFEPIIDRTTGSQFRISATGSEHSIDYMFNLKLRRITTEVSYELHKPISLNWQYKGKIAAFLSAYKLNTTLPSDFENGLIHGGFYMDNELHYLVDTRQKLSLNTTFGFNDMTFTDLAFLLERNQLVDYKYLHFSVGADYEYQISRTSSINFGLNLSLSQDTNFTTVNMGIKF